MNFRTQKPVCWKNLLTYIILYLYILYTFTYAYTYTYTYAYIYLYCHFKWKTKTGSPGRFSLIHLQFTHHINRSMLLVCLLTKKQMKVSRLQTDYTDLPIYCMSISSQRMRSLLCKHRWAGLLKQQMFFFTIYRLPTKEINFRFPFFSVCSTQTEVCSFGFPLVLFAIYIYIYGTLYIYILHIYTYTYAYTVCIQLFQTENGSPGIFP